jgi:hypothetical protein
VIGWCNPAPLEPLEAAIMNPRQCETVAALILVLAGWAAASLAGFGSAIIESAGAAAVPDHHALSLDAVAADVPQASAIDNATIDQAGMSGTAPSATGTGIDPAAGPDEPQPGLATGSIDPSQRLPGETPPAQTATTNASDPKPSEAKEGSIEIVDECLVLDTCVDRYLWTLYQRTPKEDSIRVEEQRQVTVKRRGKTRTVTQTFSRQVDEDFAWKDPKAAEKCGMPMMVYVIGGMDGNFKLRLFQALHAAEQAGLSPGITSAFRDDYRQSLASGLRAATDRSYHGGSFRGGYGHGLAADIVSVTGGTRDERWTSSEVLWKWIDEHGKEFGIGRPYLGRDPAHVAPTDGKEYADHHHEPKIAHAESEMKRSKLAARDHHGVAKHARSARSSKVRTI